MSLVQMKPEMPQPQPCHNCSHSFIGILCPICKEERPTYAALKKLIQEHDLAQKRRLAPEAI